MTDKQYQYLATAILIVFTIIVGLIIAWYLKNVAITGC
jgi:hypothetical protein